MKAKGGRGANVKSRIQCSRADRDGITPDGLDFVAGLVGDVELAAALRPVLTTDYTRITLIDPADRTRLTFDRQLRCTGTGGTSAVLDVIIVETKSAVSHV